jgi:ribonuclease P/MRP protein subunit RPP40
MCFVPTLKLALVTVYRPPACPTVKFNETIDRIRNWLESYEKDGQLFPTVILTGDFNFPFMNCWDESDTTGLRTRSGIQSQDRLQAIHLLDLIDTYMMEQTVSDGTRNLAVLDLCFTNNQDLVASTKSIENILISDHKTMISRLNMTVRQKSSGPSPNFSASSLPEFDLEKASESDWIKIRQNLSTYDWSLYRQSESADQFLATLIQGLVNSVSSVLKTKAEAKANPLTANGKTFASKNKIPREVRTLLRRKLQASHHLKAARTISRCVVLRDSIAKAETELRDSLRLKKLTEEQQAWRAMRTSPNSFFRYVNKMKKVGSNIGPLTDNKGNPLKSTVANSLNEQFVKVFSVPVLEKIITDPNIFFGIGSETSPGSPGALGGGKSPSQPPGGPGGTPNEVPQQLSEILITNKDIIDAMSGQAAQSCPGPDGVPARLIKECLSELVDHIRVLFQYSIDSGDVPHLFKSAFIKPALKPGKNKSMTSSYRPLSMTSILSKCLERILRKRLQDHLEVNGLFTTSQHGFRSGRSCLTQLLDHYDRVIRALETGANCDVVYLDYAKAFDKVDIGILMDRMTKKGISGKIGRWILAWLTGRVQAVLADGDISISSPVTSGVPQGSVLGPLLFLVMIDSIADCGITGWLSIFADDTRVARVIPDTAAAQTLQDDLYRVYEWKDEANMEFNEDKFEVLQYGSQTELKESYNYLTPADSDLIESKDCLKDLGVIMSADGKFDSHIAAVVQKVRKLMGWFRRSFICREYKFMKFFWRTYILPHLDYASQLWSPGEESQNLQKLEGLLRTFTSWFPGTNHLSYWERLEHLRLYSIQRRFERYRLIYTWKVVEGRVPNCGLVWKYSISVGRTCIPPQPKHNRIVRNLRNNSFQAAGPRLFNALPVNIRDFSGSPEGLKKQLDQILQLVPDHPIVPGGPLPEPMNQITAVNTNSFTEWSRHLSLSTRRRKTTLTDHHCVVIDPDNSVEVHSAVIDM